MCWVMWTKKKSVSPSSSIGELIASTSRKIPSQNRNWRQPGTGCPRRFSVRARRKYPYETSTVGSSWSGARFQLVRSEASGTAPVSPRRQRTGGTMRAATTDADDNDPLHLFHYHLVTSQVRTVEARYLGKLGFRLLARYGRVGERAVTVEPGVSWEQLERDGFKLRLTEVQRGSLDVVLQPGLWRVPRLDHVGVVMDDEDDYHAVLERAATWGLPVQDRSSRRTFVSTGAGYRLEVHPPRPWIEELLAERGELELSDLRLRTSEPNEKASALADLLGLEAPRAAAVEIGGALVQFLPGGPEGRPELYAERFV